MANITLWHKIALTDTLGSVPPSQKIFFNRDEVSLKRYDWPSWNNNIKATSNDNRVGKRSTNMEDAGFEGVDILLVGHVNISEIQESTNLFNFIKILQTSDNYPHGPFCIDDPNAPLMSIEATNKDAVEVHGLVIKKPKIFHNFTNKSYDFELPLVHGGVVFSP